MFGLIRKAALVEISSFTKLPEKTRNLIVSYTFQGAAYPFVSTFLNAFILRNEGEFINVVLYNLSRFIGLPTAFLLNGLLLKRYKLGLLYLTGAILVGLSAIFVVLFSKIVPIYYLYGFIFGFGEGFYWANRNYLTLKQTESANRNYFIGLNFTFDTIVSIVIPFVAGWFIVFGRNIGIESYTISIIIAFILLIISGLLVYRKNYDTPHVENILIKNQNKTWGAIRFLTLAIGIVEGSAFFFITLLILNKLGHEGILGTIDSLVAIIIGISSYYYGRRAKVIHQKPIYITSVFLGLFASLLLVFGIQVSSALIFISAFNLSIMFMWLTSDPTVMDIMDNVIGKNISLSYSYVFDRELFLNMGRWISVAISIILIAKFGDETFLKLNPFIIYLLHFLVLAFIWKKLPKKVT